MKPCWRMNHIGLANKWLIHKIQVLAYIDQPTKKIWPADQVREKSSTAPLSSSHDQSTSFISLLSSSWSSSICNSRFLSFTLLSYPHPHHPPRLYPHWCRSSLHPYRLHLQSRFFQRLFPVNNISWCYCVPAFSSSLRRLEAWFGQRR